jgi:hypothetical protein
LKVRIALENLNQLRITKTKLIQIHRIGFMNRENPRQLPGKMLEAGGLAIDVNLTVISS